VVGEVKGVGFEMPVRLRDVWNLERVGDLILEVDLLRGENEASRGEGVFLVRPPRCVPLRLLDSLREPRRVDENIESDCYLQRLQ
jgi:hypothetical protein